MTGNAVGTITLEVSADNGGSWNSVWSRTGNQGSAWNTADVDLAAYAGSTILLRFNGVSGTSWQGDIALDNIEVTGGSAADTQAPTAPTGLVASNVQETTLTLNWNASSDNVGVTGYEVFQGTNNLGSVTGTSANITGLTAGTAYTFTVRAKDAAGNVSEASNQINVTTTGGAIACSSTVNAPYTEGFESGLGGWTQVSGDDFNWTRRSGGTPSNGTGPASAVEGSFYLYVESSSPNFSNKTTIIEGPCFNLSGESSASFTFRYHMYGASAMGSLSLQASTNGTSWSNVWSRSGNQGNSWLNADVDMSAYAGSTVKLRFVGTTGTTWQGDMAIDNLAMNAGGGSGTTDVTLTIVLDNYPEETSWQIRSGSTVVASGGTYGSQADGYTVVENVTLADGCYDFIISDVYGDGICCSYGNGSYNLTAGSTTLASGGAFGSSETTNFCVGNGTTSMTTQYSDGIREDGFRVYPNPTSGILNLYTGKMKDVDYTITNAAGQVLNQGHVESNEDVLEIHNLKAGIYFLKVTDGENVIITKIFKD